MSRTRFYHLTSVKDRAPHPLSSTKSSAKRLGEYGCTIDVNPRVRATEPARCAGTNWLPAARE